MSKPELWTATQLPAGGRRLVLHAPASRRSSFAYLALSAALFLGGLGLLARGSCFFGLALAAVGGWMLLALYRLHTRGESWDLSPGSAKQTLRGRQLEHTLPRRLRFEADTDSDDRQLLRLFLVHGAGETPVGESWERTDPVEELARAMGEALGVPVDSVPEPLNPHLRGPRG